MGIFKTKIKFAYQCRWALHHVSINFFKLKKILRGFSQTPYKYVCMYVYPCIHLYVLTWWILNPVDQGVIGHNNIDDIQIFSSSVGILWTQVRNKILYMTIYTTGVVLYFISVRVNDNASLFFLCSLNNWLSEIVYKFLYTYVRVLGSMKLIGSNTTKTDLE